MKKLVIIGGGISGLAAAWKASRSGAETDVTLIERDERLGGKILTDAIDGFLLEQGPDSFLTTRPEALQLCRELGIADGLIPRTPRKSPSFIMHGHALFPLPEGFSGMVPTDSAALAASPLLSEAGKKRVRENGDLPAGTGKDDESVASFMIRRWGEEAFQLLVEPLVGGIHAGDARLLSREAIVPPPRRTTEPGAGTGPPFLTFTKGTTELVRALERRLTGITILRGAAAESITRRGRGYVIEVSGGEERVADALIIATPAHEAARLLAPLDAGMQEMLGLIPFASTIVIHLAYRRADIAHPLDGYGYLIPSVEGSDLVACTWSSQKWEGRAPRDHVLLRLMAGRFGRRDLRGRAAPEIFKIARDELSATMGITAAPLLQQLHWWDRGMPQYTVGHVRRVEAINERAARFPGLFLAGSSYRGVGIPQCVESGVRAASSALGHFAKQGVHS